MLGLRQLDELLEAVRYPPGNQARPASRQTGWDSTTATESATAPSPDHEGTAGADTSPVFDRTQQSRPELQQVKARPTTIEISSHKSAAGKTSLLYYLCALAALPKHVGGKASAVVYIDSDGRFSARRLKQIMQHYIIRIRQDTTTTTSTEHVTTANPSGGTTMLASGIDDKGKALALALDASQHIHVFRPQSSSQVLTVLDSLPSYLLDRSRHSSIHRPLGLLVLDSATAFYWQDRFDRDRARLELTAPDMGIGGVPAVQSSGLSPTAETIIRLKAVQDRFECVVAFTTNHPSELRSARVNHTQSNTTQTQMQPPPPSMPSSSAASVSSWTSYATLSLDLSRSPVLQFAPQMSLDECLRDADKRVEAVRNARFVVKVDDLASQLRNGWTEVGQGRSTGFTFRVRNEGVDVD